MEVATLDLERQLQRAGLRVTRSRTTVLAAVQAHPHADTDMVVDAARRTLPDLSRQAVHDSLRALVEVGLVRRFQLGPVVRFEAQSRGDHHHAVCTSCGRIADVDCAGGSPSCPSPADSRGFLVSAVEIVYRGLCPDCACWSGARPPGQRLDDRLPASPAGDSTRPEPGPDSPHALLPTVAAAPPYPSSRRARLGRVASAPGPEPRAPAQPGPSGPRPQPRPLTRTDDLPAPGTRAKHQLPLPEAHPWTGPGPAVPDVAPSNRPARFQTEPRRTPPRRVADELPGTSTLVGGVDHSTPAVGTSQSPTAGATPTRRRARHEAARSQPV